MKKIIFIFSLFLIGFSTQAQDIKEVKKKKNAKITFEVNGICGMCKKRIETAALKTKGVKFAIWDVKSHQINVILDERKTPLDSLKQNIANVGHDIKGFKASDEAYNSVHPCCKYRDSKIILDHEGELKKEKN
ncbi:heavy-metal-associated domain-containing protein [Polaribacter sp. PL03]|uniref:heavy-metal-associated domain-containing protein n=1 Tax=Polaribacter sp. PL03 TaxID=3088353 RepID=UPI0029D35FFD|nr:heavy-metal-associated domain-containing protein [Polaribacter sp. PL03]MDX6747981.1 heavy-metal-associated domain-containing protein [Polaribacter sp. PL03]